MSEKLFGTDGFRGPFDNSETLGRVNVATFTRIAEAYADLVRKPGETDLFVVGGDTRESSEALCQAVSAGVTSSGAEVWNVGTAPTPVIAWLAQEHEAHAIVITASHNRSSHNGIKLFDKGGVKPSAETLRAVEVTYRDDFLPGRRGSYYERTDLLDTYLQRTSESIGGPDTLAGKIVAVDAANGAAWELAPRLYKTLGAYVVPFACAPKGNLINHTGATHLDKVGKNLREYPQLVDSANFIGLFANDGDADRVLGVDARGEKVDGNYWLKRLAVGQRGIVGTLYTNSALRQTVTDMGVEFHECDNGDSHVTARLKELTKEQGPGFTRGGEFTGHMIDLQHLSSGDGLYMGAWLAANLTAQGETLSDLHDEMTLWPEEIVDIELNGADAQAILEKASVQERLAEVKAKLGASGRIVLRASGTEPLVRLWVEAQEKAMVDETIASLHSVLVS